MASKSFNIDNYDTPFSKRDYERNLRKEGYKELGSGCFATTFGKPNKRTVVKVGIYKEETFWTNNGKLGLVDGNHAYMAYIRAIRTKQDNPFFPKVKSVQFHHYAEDNGKIVQVYFIVELERLKELSYNDTGGVEIAEMLFDGWSSSSILIGFGAYMPKQLLKWYKQSLQVIQRLKRDHCDDLHNGNIMVRKNGELVITDPVC